VLARCRGDELTLFIHQNGARTARAYIHSQKHLAYPRPGTFVRSQNKCSKPATALAAESARGTLLYYGFLPFCSF
jgi:hypothetical protein